ncbi:CLUMA_CG013007, isoform A [Clunio marinus]|uniref:CLUMA_CG013007, isoform A n=1 Tax=Clunio marinus TaxID=568069 RepID=A0A1J1IHK6_9DIPT|nr:CLUMA_CG013007, isoform A [Clunio marinus]
MHRNNYHNISNNFVHKETLHPEMNSNQIRQTRSSAAFPAQSPMVALPTPTPIFTKEEVSPVTQTVTQQQQPQPVTLEPSKPSLKHEDGPSTSTSNIPIKMDEDSSNVRPMSEEDLLKLRKINFKKKVSGKEKRVRQNRKLFRILTPRNAIAALNELHGQSINESVVLPAQGNKFEAEITINNVKYTGLGSNKMQAKNAASEQALRDLIIKKFHQIKNQEITIPSSEDDVPMDEDKGDDVPMLQLASYALHKLFAEWEAEGYEIPLPKVNSPTDSALVVSPTGEEL